MYLGFLPKEYFSKGDGIVKGEHKKNPESDPQLSLAGLTEVPVFQGTLTLFWGKVRSEGEICVLESMDEVRFRVPFTHSHCQVTLDARFKEMKRVFKKKHA